MITKAAYRRIVVAGGWYDIVAAVGFATPWTFAIVYQGLVALNQALGFSQVMPVFEPLHVLMANMFGAVVTVWGILRVRDPQLVFGRFSAAIRLLLISLQLYAFMNGASPIILGISAVLLLFAIAESLPTEAMEQQGEPIPSMK